MRGNVLGPVDKTVNVLIDRSYPVVKEVFKNLDAIKSIYKNEAAILNLHENIDNIDAVGKAAEHLNRIYESIDKLDQVQANLHSILSVSNKLYQIEKASEIADKIDDVSDQIKEIITVANNIDPIVNLSNSVDILNAINNNLQVIKDSVNNAKRAEEAANIAVNAKNSVDASVSQVNNKAEEAKNFYNAAVAQSSGAIDQITTLASAKKEELQNIAGTYYIPYVSKLGDLTWGNTGGMENPPSVNIKGPKGEKGEAGTGLKISGEFATLDELPKSGTAGLTYYISGIGECYTWDVNKKAWVSVGAIKGAQGDKGEPGQSANEILMTPDPVAYFDQIYGTTDLITGDLIVDISGTDIDAVDIFEGTLKK